MITTEADVAFSDWMWPTRSRKETIKGMLPTMSMTAKRTMVAESISEKENPIMHRKGTSSPTFAPW
jgi:hypothetical protein